MVGLILSKQNGSYPSYKRSISRSHPASFPPLCLTWHRPHSSVQISKNTSTNSIVLLYREERKSCSIVTMIKLIMPADEWGTISVIVCNDCSFPRTIRAEGNCCNVKWNLPPLFITQEDGACNAVKKTFSALTIVTQFNKNEWGFTEIDLNGRKSEKQITVILHDILHFPSC